MNDPLRNIDPKVEDALARIDRELFVPEILRKDAQLDRPVAIGFGQTCSQPRLVAYMTQELEIDEGSRVLEIGTGCGYQTALLLELGCHVYSVEIIRDLAESAEMRLTDLGYENFHIRVGDGSDGWKEHAPFDACVFTCATRELPKKIIDQMKIGGRVVYPLETGGKTQNLIKSVKLKGGKLESEFLTSVLFVPLLKSYPEE